METVGVSTGATKFSRHHRKKRPRELWYCRRDAEDTVASNKEDIEETVVGYGVATKASSTGKSCSGKFERVAGSEGWGSLVVGRPTEG